MGDEQRQNKEIVLRWAEEVVNQGKLDVVDELFSEGFRWQMPFSREPLHGPEAMRETVAAFRRAFGDLAIEPTDVFAERDRVALSYKARGTNDGEMMGAPPTGESAEWRVTHVFTLRDAKIIADVTVLDRLRIMEQLGQAATTVEA